MTESATISGTLAGASFRFHTAASDLAAYARVHLADLTGAASAEPAIDATLRWHDGQPPRDRLTIFPDAAGAERIDRDLYVTRDQLWWFRVDDLRDLFLHMSWRNDRLQIEGDFYFRLGNSRLSDTIRRARQWRRRDDMRARRFTTLLAYLVYYPCWWWLEQTRDVHPIHAAGVLAKERVILLAGASGAGKSTLATALALTPDARLLGDSFVLHAGADVLPVREPLLLDAFSRRWLGAGAAELRPLQGRYALRRSGYQLPPARLADGGRAAVVLFPRRGSAPYVRRISGEDAHRRLSAADLIINDLRRYWAFAAVMEQLAPAGLMARREAHLAALTADAACYDVGLTAEMSCAGAVQAMLDLLPDQALRAVGSRQ